MIIKSATSNNGWRYTDHAENVIVNHTSDKGCFRNECGVGDYFIEDIAYVGDGGDDATPDYLIVDAAIQNGHGFYLITNRAVYLLNDSGKTIERLN